MAAAGASPVNRTAKTSAPATPRRVRGVVPADEHGLAGPARDGSVDDAHHAKVERVAVGRGDGQHLTDGQPESLRQARRDDGRATIVEGRQGSAAVAGDEPEATILVEVLPDHGRGIGPRAVERDIELGDRTDPGDAGHGTDQVGFDAFVLGDRPDGGDDEIARDDIGDPAGGSRTRMLPDPTEGDDHRDADGQAAERQGGPAAIADDRTAGEPLLEPEQDRERGSGDPRHDRQHERDEQRGDEQDAVDGQRLDGPGAVRAARQDDHADDGDDPEHGDQPAEPRVASGRQVETGLERFDRLDPTRPARRLDGGREGHADTDHERDERGIERQRRSRPG